MSDIKNMLSTWLWESA